jgi:hypothetical protein
MCLGNVKLLTLRGAKPIFYLSVGKLIRLATKTVKGNEFVTRNEIWKGPVERRGTNMINGEKLSCQGKLNYLQCALPNVLMPPCIFANGPAV